MPIHKKSVLLSPLWSPMCCFGCCQSSCKCTLDLPSGSQNMTNSSHLSKLASCMVRYPQNMVDGAVAWQLNTVTHYSLRKAAHPC